MTHRELKALIVVPNIEKIEGPNGLDERLLTLFNEARNIKLPIHYALNKFKLGKACRKKYSSVSIMGFLNIDGNNTNKFPINASMII